MYTHYCRLTYDLLSYTYAHVPAMETLSRCYLSHETVTILRGEDEDNLK